ncbi:hypothetical protein [Pseudomonas amygdali]|uniref:Uncharacterized protein n=2 Tax=Pseudomonas amygdali pv. lachrymans TaxID=53707 RepID=A0AAD0PWM8_PSEAV|nr:hypothetical protein [Pseudomonas amygdali]AXH60139.1 hypothetical protein PLA107_033680 [Pseudomonas amygdali pv. lachrymans str. M301315]
MFSSSTVPCSITHVCRHTETVNISYRFTKEKEQEKAALAKTLCSKCSKKLEELFKNPGETVFDLVLPPLRGSDKQVAWANKLRDQRWAHHGALLQTVSLQDDKDPLTLPLYRALLAFGSMDDARFWIDTRDNKLGHWGLKSDVEFFIKEPGYGVVVGEFSPYGRLKKFNPSLLGQIMRAELPTLEASDQPQAV